MFGVYCHPKTHGSPKGFVCNTSKEVLGLKEGDTRFYKGVLGLSSLNLRKQVRNWTHCHLESPLLRLGLLVKRPRGVVPKMKVLIFKNKQIKLGDELTNYSKC